MDLINDLGTDLAFAFLVEKRYGQKIDSAQAIELICRVTSLLESVATRSAAADPSLDDGLTSSVASH